MKQTGDALLTIRQTVKFYDRCLEGVRERYGLSKIEVVIVNFLHNHPGRDSVGDIAEMRMLSKGNVSRGADSLIRRGLLRRETDREDRRAAHLQLTPDAAPLVEELEAASREFISLAFESFSEEECALFGEFLVRLKGNVSRNLERSPMPCGK